MKKIKFFECLEEIATKRNLELNEDIGKYWDFLKGKRFLEQAMHGIKERNFYKDFSKNVFRLPTIIEIEQEIKRLTSDFLTAQHLNTEQKDEVSKEEAQSIMNKLTFHRDLMMYFKMPVKKIMEIKPIKNYVRKKSQTKDVRNLIFNYLKKIEVNYSV